jgi:hypothetical protein
MVIASKYGLIPYSPNLLPLSSGNSDFLPARHDGFQGNLGQHLLDYAPFIPQPKIAEKSNSIYTEDSKLSSIGMPEIGFLIDVYA